MNATKKIAIIIAGILIAAGLIIAGIALFLIRFDFSSLNTMEFETVSYPISGSFRNIDIQTTEHDIRLAPSNDGECRLVCVDSTKILHNLTIEDHTLKVRRIDKRHWYEHIGIYWGDNLSVTLYLPEGDYQNLRAKSVSGDIELPAGYQFTKQELQTTSGDIRCREASATDSVNVQTTSGDIALHHLKTDALTVHSTSGDILFDSASANIFEVNTTSGEITVQNLTADTLNVHSTSGDVALTNAQIKNEAALQTVSGEIELFRSDAGSFRIKTTSGDVEGTLLSPKNYKTKTSAGDVHIPPSDPAGGECTVTTSSGDIIFRIQN